MASPRARITANLTGFADVTRTGMPLLVVQTITLNLQMSSSNVQETLTVTGERRTRCSSDSASRFVSSWQSVVSSEVGNVG